MILYKAVSEDYWTLFSSEVIKNEVVDTGFSSYNLSRYMKYVIS